MGGGIVGDQNGSENGELRHALQHCLKVKFLEMNFQRTETREGRGVTMPATLGVQIRCSGRGGGELDRPTSTCQELLNC